MYLYHGRANAIHPYERDITTYKHLDILKILIQNQVTADKFYIETCRGEDASIASLQDIQ